MPNTSTITLGGREYALRASNLASKVYGDEFFGNSPDGYNGSLTHDASMVFADCIGESDDGGVIVRFVPPTLWRIVWALAYAGGSVAVGYERWMSDVGDEAWTVTEQANACVEAIDLVMSAFFREQPQQGGKGAQE